MKIRIELDEKLKEDEVLIRTSRLTDEIAEIQKTIVQTVNNFQKFTFYKGTTEYFLELRDILFFEFAGSHKQVYVSRNYYKALVNKIQEKRVHT